MGYFVDDCSILEVKSFLKEAELTRYQQKQVKNVKTISSEFIDVPPETISKRLAENDISIFKSYEHNLKLRGEDPDKMDKAIFILGSIIMIAGDYGLTLSADDVSDWIKANAKSYPSVNAILEGHGWEFSHKEFGAMARDAMRELGGVTPPVVGYDIKIETSLYMTKDIVVDNMNKRRNKY